MTIRSKTPSGQLDGPPHVVRRPGRCWMRVSVVRRPPPPGWSRGRRARRTARPAVRQGADGAPHLEPEDEPVPRKQRQGERALAAFVVARVDLPRVGPLAVQPVQRVVGGRLPEEALPAAAEVVEEPRAQQGFVAGTLRERLGLRAVVQQGSGLAVDGRGGQRQPAQVAPRHSEGADRCHHQIGYSHSEAPVRCAAVAAARPAASWSGWPSCRHGATTQLRRPSPRRSGRADRPARPRDRPPDRPRCCPGRDGRAGRELAQCSAHLVRPSGRRARTGVWVLEFGWLCSPSRGSTGRARRRCRRRTPLPSGRPRQGSRRPGGHPRRRPGRPPRGRPSGRRPTPSSPATSPPPCPARRG